MIYLTNIDLNQNQLMNAVIQPLAADPSNPKLGQIYCNSSNKKIMWYNGSSWKTIGVIVEDTTPGDGKIVVDGVEMTVYTLPIASSTTLGGIKIGSGININATGVASVPQSDWNQSDTTAYDYIKNKPTALSAFTNDESFIKSSVNNLANYYLKTETYTQTEINTMIGNIATIQISVVDSLPATGKSNIIYLVPKGSGTGTNNVKDEYVWTGTVFEKIGDTEIDLTPYLTKTGDAKDTTVTFTNAGSRSSLATGESMSVLIGKISKYLSDLKTVAFSNSYNDLDNKPTLLKSSSATIATTETTKSISYTGTFINAVVKDSITNEIVLCDIDVTPSAVVATLASTPKNALSFSVSYL